MLGEGRSAARARILAAAIAGAAVDIERASAPRDDVWRAEPVDEAEPWRTRTVTRRKAVIRSADQVGDGATAVTTLTVPRRRV